MEFRTYWAVIRRRWWILAVLLLLTLALTLISQRPWQPRPPAYALGMSFSVGVRPNADSTEYNYDGYYSALASEYLIDDFAAVVKGSEFASAVSERLTDEGISVAPGVIQGSTQTGTLHRILQMTVYGGDPAQLERIADAAATTLTEDADQFMPRLLADQGAVYLIDRGGVAEIGPGLRQRLDLPLRLILAFIAGIGLIFLLEYLDDRIRGRADVEAMGIAVLGEVPRQ